MMIKEAIVITGLYRNSFTQQIFDLHLSFLDEKKNLKFYYYFNFIIIRFTLIVC
jgi:hypothetical protein